MDECDFKIPPKLEPLETLAKKIYEANKAKGFWNTEMIVRESKTIEDSLKGPIIKALNGQRIALMHSELSEALEADRKDLKDDKLPQYKGIDVEVIDCLIRILDYCGAHNVPVDEILKAKLAFNETRPYLHGKKY